MKRNKKNYGFAYVRFGGIGGFQEKFLSALIENDIELYDISEDKCVISAIVKASDYFFICKLAKKYAVRIRVIEKHGLYFRLYGYRKRWGLIIGPMCCAVVILILSQFVWDIRITGNENLSRSQLYSLANDCGIYPGAYVHNFLVSECECKGLADIKLLSWISVEREGSRVYIKVKEREPLVVEEIPPEVPCNIVSDYDCQLISATVKRGVKCAEVGDGIKKGQLLISGAVDNNNDGMIYVHAEGELVARCYQTEEFYLPFTQEKRKPLSENKYTTYFMFGDFSVRSPFDNVEISESDDISYREEYGYVNIFGIKTPLRYKKGIYTFYEKEQVTYRREDVVKQLNQQRADFEANFLRDEKVVSAESEFVSEKDGIRLRVKYTVDRNIGVKQKISLIYE